MHIKRKAVARATHKIELAQSAIDVMMDNHWHPDATVQTLDRIYDHLTNARASLMEDRSERRTKRKHERGLKKTGIGWQKP